MAVQFSAPTETASAYNGRITVFVVISCIMAAMGGVIFGYDIGVAGGILALLSCTDHNRHPFSLLSLEQN
ncbi:hypothetical protein Cni_G04068 [Canna indica]|uniref:Uncharacterized protein n=1 Tax=Canna indica TaxID=4628 RepID=A0AAQ3JSQ7_9LILI|nr:hypothetical protein Cni_G04068 [Canna indica]